MDYSQNGESTYLESLWKKEYGMNFVEIGALDGVTNSNSRYFLEKGWSAQLYEPNPESYQKAKLNNIFGKKCVIHNCGIGKINGKIPFEKCSIKGFEGHSKFSSNGTIKVPIIRPSDMTKDLPFSQISIMTIDAEGMDNIICKAMIEDKLFPHILMVESNSFQALEELKLILNDYYFLNKKISVNTIWVLK